MMALAALTTAEAKKVKFQVDMTGQTISANGVHVAGSFQGWNPSGTPLSNGGSGDIYSTVVDIPAGQYYEFKFINDNNWGSGEEQIPAINQVGSNANGGSNSNRWLFVDSVADDTTVFPAVLFGGSAPAGMQAVRLAVDLKNESTIDPNIFCAGDFTNWGAGQMKMTNLFGSNKVYELIVYLASGTYGYKFKNGDAGWESVPTSCDFGTSNRQIIVASADITADKVCLGACSACPTATYPMTFIVDMSNSDCDGGYDSVTVTGAGSKLTSFGNGFKMTEIGTSKIFTYTIADIDSGEVKFKFRYHKNGTTNWEGGNDRIFTLMMEDTIDLTCFGSRTVGACPSKPAPSSITFKVDMTNETPNVVYVMGTFQTPNWQGGALRMSPSVGQPGVFEVTVNNVCPGTFNYKFVNGDSSVSANEENFPDSTNRGCVESSGVGGFNRVYTRTSANPVTLYYVYNSCTAGTNVGINEIGLSSTYKLFPNPAQAYTTIEFNDHAASHDVAVMDITGKVVLTYNNQTQNAVTIQTDGLSKGMYFIKATNTRNESVTSKLIVR